MAVNRPEDSVVAWRTTSPVASFFTITLAPAMTAWDASCTTPLMAPVAPPWGHIDPARNAMQATVTTSLFVKVKASSLHKPVCFVWKSSSASRVGRLSSPSSRRFGARHSARE